MHQRFSSLDSIKRINTHGVAYWSGRDLMTILGYASWDSFRNVIQRAKKTCKNTGQFTEDHFVHVEKMIELGKGGQREVNDYLLSRFACYLIAQNGDPRKEQIAAAQAYFAISTRAYEMHQLLKEQEECLEKRLQVSESYKQLAAAAQDAGVFSENFGTFMDAGYVGLHRHTLEELKTKKGIPENEEYLDRIGRAELAAIDFKNTQTEDKLRRDQVTGEDKAIQTHYYVGDQVRKTLETLQAPMPEDLPPAPSIRKLVEERRRAAKNGSSKRPIKEIILKALCLRNNLHWRCINRHASPSFIILRTHTL